MILEMMFLIVQLYNDELSHTINPKFSIFKFWWNAVISEFGGTQSSLDFGGYSSKKLFV